MRAVIQRVSEASVTISNEVKAKIAGGFLILVGIEDADDQEDVEWLAGKICRLRVMPDAEGVMNCSIEESKGEVIVVSQFTLHAKTKKGNRPSYIHAAAPEKAIPLYNSFVASLETILNKKVGTGEFGADMKVALVNDGPVTILIDTKNKE